MPCALCQKDAEKKIPLYGHNPSNISVCCKHSWELFLMGERRFMNKYHKNLGGQFKPTTKKLVGQQNSSLGQAS